MVRDGLAGKPFGGIATTTRRGRAKACLVALVTLATAACTSGSPSVLSPEGESAKRIDGLWWLMLWISAAVFAVVGVLMAVAIVRRGRRGPEVDATEPRWGDPFVVVAGVLLPVLILTGVFVVSVRDMNAITAGDPGPLTVQVVGHMWWWEVRYPGGAVTANEIHIPTGEAVRFEVSSVDVIHSLWVPQLAPKIDMIPGRTNFVVVQTDTPGRYRGQCAEFCGLQHANMAFFVIAQPPAEFETWLANEARPAETPSGQAAVGLQVFLDSSCAGCHTIRGTDATATLGPDLTHLASRQTIAAGTLANTPSNLAHWITDPQSIKPGAVMPPTELTAAEHDAVLAYLESLS